MKIAKIIVGVVLIVAAILGFILMENTTLLYVVEVALLIIGLALLAMALMKQDDSSAPAEEAPAEETPEQEPEKPQAPPVPGDEEEKTE